MTTVEQRLQTAETLLERCARRVEPSHWNHLEVAVAVSDLAAAAKMLYGMEWGYLAAISAADLGPRAGEIEVRYEFYAGSAAISLVVRTSRADPIVPSLGDVIPYATVFERKLSEHLGVTMVAPASTVGVFAPVLSNGDPSLVGVALPGPAAWGGMAAGCSG